MRPDLVTALQWTQWLLAAGLALQALESLVAWRTFGHRGMFVARLGLCLALFAPGMGPTSLRVTAVHLCLLATSMGLIARLRGPLCGGSDAMWFQVQLGERGASLAGTYPWLARAGLSWIAAQSVLSYALAGLAKLRQPRWRNGAALRSLLQSDGPYVIWTPASRFGRVPVVCAVVSWGLVLGELGFPLVLLMPVGTRWLFVAVGLGFHVVNAGVLGLNRFIWAWAATYPALVSL